jgi:endonuclease/exonuclease/phosphatase family metal-dependent hydrolase
MKILTANIALGLEDADNLFNNVRGIAAYHSYFSLFVELFVPPLRGKYAGPWYSLKRVEYLRAGENLEPTFRMIRNANPDILIVNEVVTQMHEQKFRKELTEMGFKTISIGLAAKYPDARCSTLVASKFEGAALQCTMPQLPCPGGGSGVAGLRLQNGISVIGAHLALGIPELWNAQVEAIARFAAFEQARGQAIIIAGDCNEIEAPFWKHAAFLALGLVSVDAQKTPTSPLSLPRFLQKSIDHIFIPASWRLANFETIAFGSDHLALLADALA